MCVANIMCWFLSDRSTFNNACTLYGIVFVISDAVPSKPPNYAVALYISRKHKGYLFHELLNWLHTYKFFTNLWQKAGKARHGDRAFNGNSGVKY